MTATFSTPIAGAAPMPAADGHARTGASWRIRTAPAREPRFDDEQPARHLSLVGRDAVALPFAVQPAVQADDRIARSLCVVADAMSTAPHSVARPDVERFGRQLFTGLLEVLAGRRPAVQLAPLTSPRIHAGITRDAAASDRLGCAGARPILRSMRVSEPSDGVAELSAVIAVGNRYRAMAARVESSHGRWRCVRLQIG